MGRKRGWSGGQRRDWKRKWEDRKAVFLPTPSPPTKPPVGDLELHPPTARYFTSWNKPAVIVQFDQKINRFWTLSVPYRCPERS